MIQSPIQELLKYLGAKLPCKERNSESPFVTIGETYRS